MLAARLAGRYQPDKALVAELATAFGMVRSDTRTRPGKAATLVKKPIMTIGASHATQLLRDHGIMFFPKLLSDLPIQGAAHQLEKFTKHLPARFMPLGAYSYTRSFFVHVARIGRYCSIGENVTIMGNRHPVDWVSSSPVFYRRKRARAWDGNRTLFPEFEDLGPPIEIGNDVWVGDDVLIAHGVKLGTGAVIAARSIVTRDVAPYTIVAGSPARTVRQRFADDVVERLLKSAWWEWPVSAWDQCDPRAVDAFLDHADAIRETHPRMPEARFTPGQLIVT